MSRVQLRRIGRARECAPFISMAHNAGLRRLAHLLFALPYFIPSPPLGRRLLALWAETDLT